MLLLLLPLCRHLLLPPSLLLCGLLSLRVSVCGRGSSPMLYIFSSAFEASFVVLVFNCL